jgi:hypothetical protein
VHGAAADEIADRLALVPLVVNVAGHRLPHRELDDLAIAAAGLISGLATTARATAKNRYARALAAGTEWCRINRHQSIPDQRVHLTAMMRGHYAYYGSPMI